VANVKPTGGWKNFVKDFWGIYLFGFWCFQLRLAVAKASAGYGNLPQGKVFVAKPSKVNKLTKGFCNFVENFKNCKICH
jgi:hypothetical protein